MFNTVNTRCGGICHFKKDEFLDLGELFSWDSSGWKLYFLLFYYVYGFIFSSSKDGDVVLVISSG